MRSRNSPDDTPLCASGDTLARSVTAALMSVISGNVVIRWETIIVIILRRPERSLFLCFFGPARTDPDVLRRGGTGSPAACLVKATPLLAKALTHTLDLPYSEERSQGEFAPLGSNFFSLNCPVILQCKTQQILTTSSAIFDRFFVHGFAD